jgi:small-conductance mechanosensitive channel
MVNFAILCCGWGVPHHNSRILKSFLTLLILLVIPAGAEVPANCIAFTQASLGGSIDAISQNSGIRWLDTPGPWGITAAHFITFLLILAISWVISSVLLRVILKKAGRIQTDRPRSWPKVVLSAARKPLALLVWAYGFYLGSGILLKNDLAPAVALEINRAVTTITYISATIASFWMLFRTVRGLEKKLSQRADQSLSAFDNILVPIIGLALRLLILVVGVFILQEALELPPEYQQFASKLAAIFLICSVAWLVIRIACVIERSLLTNYRLDTEDNLRARQIYSQVSVIRRLIVILVTALALACILMLFQPVRQFGTSLLASAGILGIVLGFASQKALTNLIAGIQIAISQPIRIDDVVIVEGEWGKVEEISLTYVTICVWDLRRLVLPIQYFIDHPFQNWTLQSSKLLNSVFLHTDYTLPIEPLRKELRRLLENHPLWDGDCCTLQVTNSKPESMELRCLMSSRDAAKGWDLKCDIREGLIEFIRANYPESLPRLRAEITRNGSSPDVGNPI